MSRFSSCSDLSSSTNSEHDDYGYETDCTTPAPSFSGDHVENDQVEEFRDHEYPQLSGSIYLDHGGSTLVARSVIESFSKDLLTNLYGNPHSDSTPSAVAGHRIDAVREKALRFFKADPAEWDLVFVANATAAIKLTSECIRDHAASTKRQLWYGYHRDAHTSLVGIRELVDDSRCFSSDEEVESWIKCGKAEGSSSSQQLGLFAFPGQSNMTGRRLPLSWPGQIRENIGSDTYTLLDAAALASTAPLDLSKTQESPDFVALSFYKIFGFPNIGALLVQKRSAHILSNRRYFGGGTVDMVISINDTWHARKSSSVHDALEDGTLPFHSIFALDHAMDVHEKLYGSDPMTLISRHTSKLAKQLHDGLSGLRHRNGSPVVHIYKETNSIYGDSKLQGATVAFNVLKADGTMVGYAEVERAADERHIYVRSGSLCNPGGMATYLGWTPKEMRAAFDSGHRCSKPTQLVNGRPTGVVRASLGAMSTSSDVRGFLAFLREVYVETTGALPPIVANAVTCSPRRASLILVQPPSPTSPKHNKTPSIKVAEPSTRPLSWDVTTAAAKPRLLAPPLPRLNTSPSTWDTARPSTRPRSMTLLLPTPETPTKPKISTKTSTSSITRKPSRPTSSTKLQRPTHLAPPSTLKSRHKSLDLSHPIYDLSPLTPTNTNDSSTSTTMMDAATFFKTMSRRNTVLHHQRYSKLIEEEEKVEVEVAKNKRLSVGFKKIRRALTLSRK